MESVTPTNTAGSDVSRQPWEQEIPPGVYEAYKDMAEDRVSLRNGSRYTLFVFRIEHEGRSFRYAYYCGHHRASELKALKYRLAVNPYCRVRLAKKNGVAGMVVEEVIQ